MSVGRVFELSLWLDLDIVPSNGIQVQYMDPNY